MVSEGGRSLACSGVRGLRGRGAGVHRRWEGMRLRRWMGHSREPPSPPTRAPVFCDLEGLSGGVADGSHEAERRAVWPDDRISRRGSWESAEPSSAPRHPMWMWARLPPHTPRGSLSSGAAQLQSREERRGQLRASAADLREEGGAGGGD